jgi:molybdopterin molybdotransferase
MQSVDTARELMCAVVRPTAAESVPLLEALGRTLAGELDAARDQPPFRSSAMDGYAMRASDAALESLMVVGESAAGRPYSSVLRAGEAARIFTGAALPDGADVVIPQERTRRDGAVLFIEKGYQSASAHVRALGADFRRGVRLVETGACLNARDIALLAAAGIAHVAVRRRPRIALLATGTEIVNPGERAGPHQIFDSVTFGLAGLIDPWGGAPLRLGIAPDVETEVAKIATRALEESDLLVIAGGASVGDYDVVKSALARSGLRIAVPQVAVRPGKPTWFGAVNGKPVLGLPGNPIAAFVCAYLFLKPMLRAYLGQPAVVAHARALLDGDVGESGANELYLRASCHLGTDARLAVRALANQDTSLVSVFAAANALIRRPAKSPRASSGEIVEILLLEERVPAHAAPSTEV